MRELVTDAVRTLVPPRGDRHGPLPPLLLALTVVTGVVDAVSHLALGHVFVANMTGNVVFLGFALAGAEGLSALASVVAMTAFLAGGRFAARFAAHRGKALAIAVAAQTVLAAAATLAASLSDGDRVGSPLRYTLIVLLGSRWGSRTPSYGASASPTSPRPC
ncbi:YoaK family protein [Streptomyces ossamyceticus]|uniref:YoaK family protein n=1 Tax=Streptomyces ossamyceticus TaxID=249581 RepID=A0ABV2UQH0_9ACTN